MTLHPDLPAEQAYIDFAYECLDVMRAAAVEMRDTALERDEELARDALRSSPSWTQTALWEREVFVNRSLRRVRHLDLGENSLCFGRIDRQDAETYYIGRVAVAGPEQEPVIVDWRAPVAATFYRATGRHPLGLKRRRHFATEGRRLTGIEDESFDEGGELGLAGPGALLAALERPRAGYMRDIVATVQREQDEVIRADLPGVLVVQGGPGTGKTAVALHRAAYLLFTHRRQLTRQGVLVIGPNPVFLSYIDRVLPALGESGVDLATVTGVAGVRARGRDAAGAARVKGDVRMARVIENAVSDRERPLREDLLVGFDGYTLRFTAGSSAQVVAAARRTRGTHNERRRHAERLVFRRLFSQYAAEAALAKRPQSATAAELRREMRSEPAVANALDRMWPVLKPEELLHDFLGAPALIASAAKGILNRDECSLLHRPRAESLASVDWTPADAPLLDEAKALLGERRRHGTEDGDDDFPTYGHIVVDEAQDLSPMQLRMLARRSRSGSMTIVGDIAQATGAWAPNAWEDVLAHLRLDRGSRVAALSVNYRMPREVMDLAARVLASAAPHLEPPRSVRSTGVHPLPIETSDVGQAVARCALDLSRDVDGGTVAVICPGSMSEELSVSLQDEEVPFGDAIRQGLGEAITLVPIEVAKGLEFDGVVVVEPSRIAREAAQGMRALYVALTRATKRLCLVHSEALPQELRAP